MDKSNLLSKKIVDTLNYRIQQEDYSSRLYEQLALWLNDNGYLNTSLLYKRYASEESNHANWAKSFLLDYGVTPCLMKLESPEMEISGLKDVFEVTLEHELDITRQCEELAIMALKEGNHVLYVLASKYCAEQQEEIGKAITNLDIFKLSTDMLIIDHYVGDKLL
jgi:ferritin